jgi:hypothetical protein
LTVDAATTFGALDGPLDFDNLLDYDNYLQQVDFVVPSPVHIAKNFGPNVGSHSFQYLDEEVPVLHESASDLNPDYSHHFPLADKSSSFTRRHRSKNPQYLAPTPFTIVPRQRSLTGNQHTLSYEMMTTTSTTAPNSDPGLSGSKSSTSSSFRSSQLDSADSITPDDSNLEDCIR